MSRWVGELPPWTLLFYVACEMYFLAICLTMLKIFIIMVVGFEMVVLTVRLEKTSVQPVVE